VFVDGPAHDASNQQAHDRTVREGLEDHGYMVVTIRYDRPFADRVAEYADVVGV
jgi:hypothetical protein